MKIILCIFLLCITVSVFGQSVKLNGVVGKSIEFPAAVKEVGELKYSGLTIGDVKAAPFLPPSNDDYRDRVQWDKSTGLFSLSNLTLEDSGVYEVNNDGQKSVSFNLTVWVPVLKPHLSVTRNEYRCTVLCAAARGTGATLTLYREGEKNPYVTSPGHSHPDLNVTQTVESGTYTCEAKNSVSRETSDPLTVGAHCTGSSQEAKDAIFIAVFVSIIFIVAFIAVVLAFKPRIIRRIIQAIRRIIQGNGSKRPDGNRSKRPDELRGVSKGSDELEDEIP